MNQLQQARRESGQNQQHSGGGPGPQAPGEQQARESGAGNEYELDGLPITGEVVLRQEKGCARPADDFSHAAEKINSAAQAEGLVGSLLGIVLDVDERHADEIKQPAEQDGDRDGNGGPDHSVRYERLVAFL